MGASWSWWVHENLSITEHCWICVYAIKTRTRFAMLWWISLHSRLTSELGQLVGVNDIPQRFTWLEVACPNPPSLDTQGSADVMTGKRKRLIGWIEHMTKWDRSRQEYELINQSDEIFGRKQMFLFLLTRPSGHAPWDDKTLWKSTWENSPWNVHVILA